MIGRALFRWLSLVWIAVAFLLFRIETQGEFTWNGLELTYDQDRVQFILLSAATAGSLLIAWRTHLARDARSDVMSVGWSLIIVGAGVALWLLGHDSAPVIVGLVGLGGLLTYLRLGATPG